MTVSTMRSCIAYVTKIIIIIIKLLLMQVQRKLYSYTCTFVCFSDIDSAYFECFPWSTGVDIQFVSLQGSPFQFSKHSSAKSSQDLKY